MDVVYIHTCYHIATYIQRKSVEELWILFVHIRATFYCSLIDLTHVDRESALIAASFRDSNEACGVVTKDSTLERNII